MKTGILEAILILAYPARMETLFVKHNPFYNKITPSYQNHPEIIPFCLNFWIYLLPVRSVNHSLKIAKSLKGR
jgi:hypothetical protein